MMDAENMTGDNSLMEVALRYAAIGWPVFPCKGKDPRTMHGFKDAVTDESEIRVMWAKWPDANIGIATGRDSFVTVDMDLPEEAKAAITQYVKDHGITSTKDDLATTTTKTRKGYHLHFSWVDGIGLEKLKNWARPVPGLDIRTTGGYVIVPPSIHPNGGEYAWLHGPDERPPKPFPGWLVDFILESKKATDKKTLNHNAARLEAMGAKAQKKRATKAKDDGQREKAYAEAVLKDEIATLRATPNGERNDRLNKSAFALGGLVGAGLLNRGQVESKLRTAARSTKLDGTEIEKTIKSGLDAGKCNPRSLPNENTSTKKNTGVGGAKITGTSVDYSREIGLYTFRFWQESKNWFGQVIGDGYKSLVQSLRKPPWVDHKVWKTDLIKDIREQLGEDDLNAIQTFKLEIQEEYNQPVEEVDLQVQTSFIEMNGGRLAEQVFDPATLLSQFAVYDPTTDEVVYLPSVDGKVPIWDDEGLLKGFVRLPSRAEEYGDARSLYCEIRAFIHRYLDVSDDYERIAAYYPMVSGVYDALNTINYLRSLGDWNTGKSRFGDVIGSICYKAISTTGATTEAPVFRIMEKWHGTLLLDEADFNKSNESIGIIKILNCGYERGRPVLRCDVNCPDDIHYYDPFGPKIISTRNEFEDKALESRCFTEVMKETTRTDIPIELPPRFYEEAASLRNKLLMYRFRTRTKVAERSAGVFNFDFGPIGSRLKQAARPIALILEDDDVEEFRRFLADKNRDLVEKASETLEGAIVKVLANSIEQQLTSQDVADMLRERGYPDVGARTIGKRLRGLKIDTEQKRINGKNKKVIVCDPELLVTLEKRYILPENGDSGVVSKCNVGIVCNGAMGASDTKTKITQDNEYMTSGNNQKQIGDICGCAEGGDPNVTVTNDTDDTNRNKGQNDICLCCARCGQTIHQTDTIIRPDGEWWCAACINAEIFEHVKTPESRGEV